MRLVAALLVALALARPATAQQTALPAGITQEQALQLLRDRPDLVRQRLRESGLSPDEVRQRLQAAGLAPSLLDPFLAEVDTTGAAVTGDVLQALDLLGVSPVVPQAVEAIPLRVGQQVTPGAGTAVPSRLFGLDVFQGRTTQFQPLLAGPVPETYRVGPGDVMVLVLTGDVELIHQLQVTREGFVIIPQVGQLYVNSLPMAELRRLFRERLGRSYSGIRRGSTHFDISIARLK